MDKIIGTVKANKTNLNKIIKWSSSRFNYYKKSEVIKEIISALSVGNDVEIEYGTGAFSERNCWGWRYIFTIKDGQAKLRQDVTGETWILNRKFTGLLDKNDNKILVGDIIKCHYETYTKQWDECFEVISFNGKFGLKTFDDKHFIPFINSTHKYCKIIGNIYDNPELLQME